MNRAADALEAAVQAARLRAAVVRALALWETWIIAGSVLYLAARFAPWALAGFPVAGAE
jgi:hypothetical protein